MNRYRRHFFWGEVLFISLWLPGLLLAEGKPDWVDGPSARYPEASYLLGVGSGDSRQRSEESAYAALARIFKVEVRSTTRSDEDFRQTEKGKEAEIDRRLNLQNRTEVSTGKVMEEVRIAERWIDPVSKVHYALAVLDRKAAASHLRQKSTAAEMEAKEWEERAQKSTDPLERARALRKTILSARRSEGYEADLRTIQPTGGGAPALVRSEEAERRLTDLLDQHFQVGVHITGPRADAVRDAVLAGLNEKGFSGGAREDILIGGEVGFEETESQDPRWRYVRWTAHLTLTQKETGKVFGSLNRSGREGHLSSSEAERKALIALQTEMTQSVGETLLKFIYGD